MKDKIFDNDVTTVHDWHLVDQIKYGLLLGWTFELERFNKICACKWWWWWWWWWWRPSCDFLLHWKVSTLEWTTIELVVSWAALKTHMRYFNISPLIHILWKPQFILFSSLLVALNKYLKVLSLFYINLGQYPFSSVVNCLPFVKKKVISVLVYDQQV